MAKKVAPVNRWTIEETAFRSILTDHVGRRPRLQVQDLYKLIYQAVRGSEHAVHDPTEVRRQLETELRNMAAGPEEPEVEVLSAEGEIVRVNLRPYLAGGGDVDSLAEAFITTAQRYRQEEGRLRRYWEYAERMSRAGTLPLPPEELEGFYAAMERAGFPAVHHSDEYRAAYRPAYRVVAWAFLCRTTHE
jgi:hypothetical protein